MNYKALVEQDRGGILENVHFGVVCGVDEQSEVSFSVGDPEHHTFLRSAAKPFQAIPAALHRIDEIYGLTSKEAALFAASHRGETYHIEGLQSIMEKTGLHEESLVVLPTYPLNDAPKYELLRHNEEKRRIYHNCSGKHFGVLATCKHLGYPLENYYEAEHPLQQEILKVFAYLTEYPQEQIGIGVDGCGFPVYALPLKNLAIGYLKLACPDLIEDAEIRAAVVKVAGWMNENPDIIASHEFICSELLRDPNIVAKGGAKGVYGVGLKKERMAFALKVIDGSELVWPTIVASILEQIGYENKETIARLYALTPSEIRNDNQRLVGENRVTFDIRQQNE
ncbi:asparaginase [Paenibacillus selenitireducens]|uniref:Asparaginase n=1 Tax=Paenibacillus selenitireducens TaxID=1324314 RepID=A0A1T2XLQ5_9BACL|nr:asparaginase [Paenibacillus selenitireducens]OPA80797.1 asparaginase [Paenibacillus selenitireducens]